MRMPPQVTTSTESPNSRSVRTWRTLGRHQLGAMAASAVDFGTMIFSVEVLHLTPVAATAIGATIGAIVNFCLGRAWVFFARSGGAATQAMRYALVSAASAGWNALGEHMLHDLGHVQYVASRALVAVAVSVFWNFPMQRQFVFREGRAP
jgi:putative flippase GtrA